MKRDLLRLFRLRKRLRQQGMVLRGRTGFLIRVVVGWGVHG
jgi:hypothetical protein